MRYRLRDRQPYDKKSILNDIFYRNTDVRLK